MMKIVFHNAYSSVSSYLSMIEQALIKTVNKLEEIRRHPEAFQRSFIITASVIQGFNFYKGTHYFPRLVEVLDSAHSFDFYGFCRLPRYIFHIYTPDKIDDYILLDNLVEVICKNWLIEERNEENYNFVKKFARQKVNDLLEEMVEYDFDVRTENEFKILLENRLKKKSAESEENKFDLNSINLTDLKIPLKETPFFEWLADSIFVVSDIICLPTFLDDWSLLDLSRVSKSLGRFNAFSWLTAQSFHQFVGLGLCTAYFFQLIQAGLNLRNKDQTKVEGRYAKWVIAASLVEIIYNVTILQRSDLRIITFFAFTAKSLGLLQILMEPEPTFFKAGASSHAF